MTNLADQVVATDRGKLRGSDEGAVVSFRGIPYAASPVGAARFAAPHTHPGWTGVREAVRPGPAVPQAPSRLERVMGTRRPDWAEDGCLTLNVWAPRPALEEKAPRPVLVWFHGGGFSSGSGGWDWYDGARLAEVGNVVVVTANYRLGPLGYLRLPRIGADNLGSQDQAAVLRWVRDNIASFGGDPRAVTVGGQSAGAYSALSLALDPATGGLVDRVLLQSGPWGLEPQSPEQAAEAAEEYQRLLDIPRGTEPGQVLRSLPVERLLSAYGELAVRLARPGNIAPPMYPVLGGAGMPRAWQDALVDGAPAGKALLIGTAQEEMTAFFAFEPRIQSLTREGAVDLLASRLGHEAPEVYQRYADRLPHATPAQVFTALQTDELFRDGALRMADHHAAGGNATYVYQFDYRPAHDPGHLGATHCGELPFLFGTFDSYPDSPMLGSPSDAERTMGRAFATAVTAFIAGGTPVDWPPYAPEATARIRHFG
ncbi:carboxylesterase/lipase family protein [Streptomyces antimycoticus]|uniref:carboxylesterase/lipase family protein n=1 Tax=Streptomyces antimycoticus TaxID=68175 RepID=UPI0036ABCE7E